MALSWPSEADAGHTKGTAPPFNTRVACLSKEAPIRLIELSHASDEVFREFWIGIFLNGKCKKFPNKLWFWFDEVVAQLSWGDGDLMYVVRGHDNTNLEIYLWVPTNIAHGNGIPEPAIEIDPAPVGLHI